MSKYKNVFFALVAVCGVTESWAQSNISIYGRVDTSIEHQKKGNVSASGMVSNKSYLGFRGVEDLGAGLKAGFVLESEFNSDDGSARQGMNFERHSEINLAGRFGLIRMGRFDLASYKMTAEHVNMHNDNAGSAGDALYQMYHRPGNVLAYRFDNIPGFKAEIQYEFGEKAVVDGRDHQGSWDFGAEYSAGALGLGLGYSRKAEKVLATGERENTTIYSLRTSYEWNNLTLGAYYQQWRAERYKNKIDIYRVAVKYIMGASEVHASFGHAGKFENFGGYNTPDSNATQWILQYDYNFSKHTKVYTFYSKVNNGVNSSYHSTKFIANNRHETGYDFKSFGVGIRHLF